MLSYHSDGYRESQMDRMDGIEFERLNAVQIANVQDMVNAMAQRLQREPPQVQSPPKGVLKDRLNPDQRKRINLSLAASYAQRNADEQKDRQHVVVNEEMEPMEDLRRMFKRQQKEVFFSDRGFEDMCGKFGSQQRIFWLRFQVAAQLSQAVDALHAVRLTAHIDDAWRPEAVQAGLFVRRVMQLAKEHDNWSDDQVTTVAKSLTGYAPGISGHQAGAAVDWRLCEEGSRKKILDVGNTYPEGSVISAIDCPYVTYDQWRNRTLFAAAAELTHLKLLRTENWHTSARDRGMGTDFDVAPVDACYGPIKGFNQSNGTISPSKLYDDAEIMQPFVTDEEISAVIHATRQKIGFKSIIQKLHDGRDGNVRGQQRLQKLLREPPR